MSPRGAPPLATRRHAVARGLLAGTGAGVLALVLALAVLVVVIPRVTGGVPLTVRSGSMAPALPVGSLAVVLPVEPEDVRVGDVVTVLPYPDDPTAVTHRVVAVAHRQDGSRVFTTRGDANDAADDPVAGHQIRGRLAYAAPGLGTLNDALNAEQRTVGVRLAAGALFAWAAVLWWRAWRGRGVSRRAGRRAGPGR